MRVRFAPSPTGALHIGGARTALYNWLLARGQGGELVLRIEDTDRERSTPENVEQIFEALRWLEIDWDGEPVFQSQRADRHAEVVEQLLASGHAYRSTAGPDEVKAYKAAHGNRGFRGEDEGAGAVRLRVPDEGDDRGRDVIRGETAFENALQDDLVIARADGTPVYHLAVVVDDLDAGITHVVRGADHYSNTPKHLLIQQALGSRRRSTPTCRCCTARTARSSPSATARRRCRSCATRLPARGGAQLPRAARLGLRRGDDVLHAPRSCSGTSRSSGSRKSPAVFDEQKLRWMNGRYLRELALDELTAGWRRSPAARASARRSRSPRRRSRRSTSSGRWRARSSRGRSTTPRRARSSSRRTRAREALEAARGALADVPEPWTPETVEAALRGGRRARRAEGQAGLPAAARRAHGHDRLAGHLRDGRAARPRADAGADRRRARRAPRRLIDTGWRLNRPAKMPIG